MTKKWKQDTQENDAKYLCLERETWDRKVKQIWKIETGKCFRWTLKQDLGNLTIMLLNVRRCWAGGLAQGPAVENELTRLLCLEMVVSGSHLQTWLLARPEWLFAWKWVIVWNSLEVVNTSRGTQMRVLHVWYISLSLFLSWHVGLPFVRELAERTRASESDQDQIPALSQINTMILTFPFLNLKLLLNKTENSWFAGLLLGVSEIIHVRACKNLKQYKHKGAPP